MQPPRIFGKSLSITAALLGFAAVAVVLAYWPGLYGPFILDDDANLVAIGPWLSGDLSLTTLLFERGAGTFGRPVSMASFAINAWLGGYTPFSLKLGNLVVHVLCGLAIYILFRRVLARDSNLASKSSLYATLIAALWLLHPLHASTVLYAVQRMAQLSTLIILLGLWLYVFLRDRLEQAPSKTGSIALLFGIPALTMLAFLAKENGILLPLLCVIVEFSYYRPPRPKAANAFAALYVLTPAIAGLLALLAYSDRLVDWYSGRDYGPVERILSQGRALCDYIWKLVAPNPPMMGVYTDDFQVSTTLLDPATTLGSWVFLLGVSAAAWHWRKRLPSVFFGWFFFLGAHVLEASPIPLELYFEHRNYLPSVGVLVAGIALARAAGGWLLGKQLNPARIGVPLYAGLLLVFAAGTHGRARVWQSELLIAESSLAAHPNSLRANAAVLSAAIGRKDEARAQEIINTLIDSPLPRQRSIGFLYRFHASCVLHGRADPDDLWQFSRTSPTPVTLIETVPLKFLYAATAEGKCANARDDQIGLALSSLADRANSQPEDARAKVVMRYYAAQFHVRARSWSKALPPARLAWQHNAEAGVAMPLVLAQLGTHDIAGAKQTWKEASQRVAPDNKIEQMGLRWLAAQIDAASRAYAPQTTDPNP